MVRPGRRVMVTGMGMATPVGLDVASSWEALREGRGGVGPVTLFDAGTFATRIAAELKDFDLGRDVGGDAPRWSATAGTRRSHSPSPRRPSRTPACSRGGDRPDEVRRLPRLGRGPGGLPPVRRPRPPLDRRRPGRHPGLHGPGDEAPRPAARGGARAGVARRPPRHRLRGEGAEPLLPDSLLGQRPGDRRGDRTDPRAGWPT